MAVENFRPQGTQHHVFTVEEPAAVAADTGHTRPALGKFIRQNSDRVGYFAENAILPRSKRSIRGQLPSSHAGAFAGGTEPQKPEKAFPIFMVTITIIQILIAYLAPSDIWLYLGYDPFRRHELWRYLTILLVHQSASHLWTNLFFQVILGVLLEIIHHWKRIAIIYLAGVLGGSLFITVFTPMVYGVGASAGVYALLFAHLATIILNWNEMDSKCCRLGFLLAYIGLDVGLSILSSIDATRKSNVSHAGHFGGALTGFLVSILVLRNFEKHPWELRAQKICKILLIFIFGVVVIINAAWPSHYYESEFNTDYEDSYAFVIVKAIQEDPDLRKRCEADEECKNILILYQNLTMSGN